jgi:hypothetical protein
MLMASGISLLKDACFETGFGGLTIEPPPPTLYLLLLLLPLLSFVYKGA